MEIWTAYWMNGKWSKVARQGNPVVENGFFLYICWYHDHAGGWDYCLIPTQPKQLEQQTKRLKEATAKVYYTDGRDNIDQKAKHNWCWLQQFQPIEAEAQKWKADEEWLAEQLVDLQKDRSCRMKCGESNQPQVWNVWDPDCARTAGWCNTKTIAIMWM